MSAADPKAVATAFGFINEDPFAPALFDSAQAVGFTGSEDVSLNMTWVIGDLGVGDSKTIRMTYEIK